MHDLNYCSFQKSPQNHFKGDKNKDKNLQNMHIF